MKSRSRTSRRRGFSLIELMTVMVIIGLLTRFGLPRYADMRSQTMARSIVGDIHAIRLAALNYHADRNAWPPAAGRGVIPNGLAPYLPGGFRFREGTVDLQWQLVNTTTRVGRTRVTVQTPRVTVRTTDPKLRRAVVTLARNGFAHALVGQNVAFIITTGS
ncbi:MAG: type II secretion system protein [Gemmatimonadota bacterium]